MNRFYFSFCFFFFKKSQAPHNLHSTMLFFSCQKTENKIIERKEEYIIVMIVTNKEVKWNHKVQTTGGLHKITTLWATL